MFWVKYVQVCKALKKSPTGFAKELDITASTVGSWKKGSIPSCDTIAIIAEKSGRSIDYFLSDDEEYVSLSTKKNTFKSIHAIPQRFVSLMSGEVLLPDDIESICMYVNCSKEFLTSTEIKQYKPETTRDNASIYDIRTLYLIFMILDRCADSDLYKAVQIQLSKIILYWTFADESLNLTIDQLCEIKALDSVKLKYLWNNETGLESTRYYGLNFTELTVLSRFTKHSYQYLLTGVKKESIDIVLDENALLKSENASLKKENQRLLDFLAKKDPENK